MMRISQDEFEALAERALKALPNEFAKLLDNIAVVTEDEPEPDLKREMGMDEDEELLGLYQGVPFGERNSGYSALPDQVVLYRGPMVRYITQPPRAYPRSA